MERNQKEIIFANIPFGTKFIYTLKRFVKITPVTTKDNYTYNAINLSDGCLASFNDNESVYLEEYKYTFSEKEFDFLKSLLNKFGNKVDVTDPYFGINVGECNVFNAITGKSL